MTRDELLDAIGSAASLEELKRLEVKLLQVRLTKKLKKKFAEPGYIDDDGVPHSGGLLAFVKYFWHTREPVKEMHHGWVLEAICLHLEACARGDINRLLINVPPGSMKSLLCSVFFPAWIWGPMRRPEARFLNVSHSADLPMDFNEYTLDVVKSDEYAKMYGDVFSMVGEGKIRISNDKTGFKRAFGIGGGITGNRADFVIVDDPNNIVNVETMDVMDETNRKFGEGVSNRLNDMTKSAIIVVQQRAHQNDVTGYIIKSGLIDYYTWLCIPFLFEGRACKTNIGWVDPRTEIGEPYWPEHHPIESVEQTMTGGDIMWAGQYQQRPESRKGGLLKTEYWRQWTGPLPKFDFILASLDSAYTAKKYNDPSGFTIWGCFNDTSRHRNMADQRSLHDEPLPQGQRAVMLLDAFSEHLEIFGDMNPKWHGETSSDYLARPESERGLVETVYERCRRWGASTLIIESKASGLSVIQSLSKLWPRRKFNVEPYNPGGLGKETRALMAQPIFAAGQVYVPMMSDGVTYRDWAKMVIDECAAFPGGVHDDLVDSTSQALNWLRSRGFLERMVERDIADEERMRDYRRPVALYRI